MRDITKTFHSRFNNSPVSVGRFSYGLENLKIYQWGEGAGLNIGSFCSLGKNIQIFLGGHHRIDWITTFPFGHIFTEYLGGREIKGHPMTKGDVTIGHDVWIGYGVTIMSGITIGNGAVIATNSHVTKDVNAYEIVGGNPAKHIKFRFSSEIIALLLQLNWWNLPLDTIRDIAPQLSCSPTETTLQNLIRHVSRPA
jgi:acetyltransferase-like isoleucine patch superfamily enzyme